MILEGMKVRFIPSSSQSMHDDEAERRRKTVTGTIVHIHWEHKLFWVQYESGGTKQMETFKLCDIGTEVQLCGRF